MARDLERVVAKALFLISPNDCSSQRTPALRNAPAPPSSPPPLAPRDAARVAICESVPGRFAQSPKRCSALVPGCPPCCDRRASGSFRGSSAANLAQSDCRSELSAAPRIASMPPALPRRPNQTRAMLIPFYAADAPSANLTVEPSSPHPSLAAGESTLLVSACAPPLVAYTSPPTHKHTHSPSSEALRACTAIRHATTYAPGHTVRPREQSSSCLQAARNPSPSAPPRLPHRTTRSWTASTTKRRSALCRLATAAESQSSSRLRRNRLRSSEPRCLSMRMFILSARLSRPQRRHIVPGP